MRDTTTLLVEDNDELITKHFVNFLAKETKYINANKDKMPTYTQNDIDNFYNSKSSFEFIPTSNHSKQAIFNGIISIYEDCEQGRSRLAYLASDKSYKYLSSNLNLSFSGAFQMGNTGDWFLSFLKTQYTIIIIIGLISLSAFLALNLILGAAAWSSALLVLGLFTTAGPVYGILNDMIATRRSPIYFMLGHNPGQRAIVESNDPDVLACSWGMLATGVLSIILAVILTIVAIFVPLTAFILPILTFSLPVLIAFFQIASLLFLGSPEYYSDNRELFSIDGYINKGREFTGDSISSIKNMQYQKNSIINGFGYLFLPLTAIGVFVASALLPNMALSPLFTLWLPAVTLLISVVFLIGCFKFLSDNHNINSNDSSAHRLDFTAYKKFNFVPDGYRMVKCCGGDAEWFMGKNNTDDNYTPRN